MSIAFLGGCCQNLLEINNGKFKQGNTGVLVGVSKISDGATGIAEDKRDATVAIKTSRTHRNHKQGNTGVVIGLEIKSNSACRVVQGNVDALATIKPPQTSKSLRSYLMEMARCDNEYLTILEAKIKNRPKSEIVPRPRPSIQKNLRYLGQSRGDKVLNAVHLSDPQGRGA